MMKLSLCLPVILLLVTTIVATTMIFLLRASRNNDDQKEDVICKLRLQIGMFEVSVLGNDDMNNSTEHKHIEMLICEPVDSVSFLPTSSNVYKVNMPDHLFEEFRDGIIETQTNPIVAITDVSLNGHEIHLSETSSLEQLAEISFESTDQNNNNSKFYSDLVGGPLRRRTQQLVRSVLILRVIATDSEPTYSKRRIYTLTFDDPVSCKWQMYKCSGAKVDLRPEQTHGGVLQVNVDLPASGTPYYEMVDAARNKALEYYPDRFTAIKDVADHIMIIVPPGTVGGLLAAAEVGGKESIYNDEWGGSVSGCMHEIGHNLALYHAGDASDKYGDKSGYMGYSRKETSKPAKCFNGANFATLGWFSDRTNEVKPNAAKAVYTKLTAFADYDRTEPGDSVLLRVGELYMVYNKAKRHNSETDHHVNRVTIVRNHESKTDLLAGLSMSNPVSDIVEASQDIRVEICDKVHVGNVDSMIVSVGPRPLSACEEYRTSTEAGTESLDMPLCTPFDACGDQKYWVHRQGSFFSCDELCTDRLEEYVGFQYECGRC